MDKLIKLLSAVVLAGFLAGLALLVSGCAERLGPGSDNVDVSAPNV